MNTKVSFIELLQVSLGTRARLTSVPSLVEWNWMLEEAQRQAVAGILACGIERLPKEQQPPKNVLLQWIGIALQIEQRNVLTTKVCGEVVGQMQRDGLLCCVLKGQANHRYYPSQMGNRRNCGDIDIWTESKHDTSNTRMYVKKVLEYVDGHYKRDGLCWLHCNFTDRSTVPVEVHFHPSFFSRPKYNRRFQKFFKDMEQCAESVTIDGVEIPVMKPERDVVYQMNHVYRHLIDEGVGLRQIIDYYYLLLNGPRLANKGFNKATVMEIVSWLGMRKFAGALMYVLKELLGMSEEHLLCEPSEREGKFLMEEILMAGNFGHQDPRLADVAQGSYLKRRTSQAWRRFKRNLRFVTSYPGEVIWEPVVRVEHFAWKKLGVWKWWR